MPELDGKQIRLSRISEKEKFILIPMDHGVADGPLLGIENLHTTIQKVCNGGCTGVIIHKGVILHLNKPPSTGLIMHVSASTVHGKPNEKRIVGTAIEAIRFGADALSIHVNMGAKTEPDMLEDLAQASRSCTDLGLPLLAMVYPRGPKIDNPYDPELLANAVRVAYELGADIIKTNYTGDIDSFKKVVQCSPAPVIIAGGPKIADQLTLLEHIAGSIEAGGAGIAIGRNIFQAQDPTKIVKAIRTLVIQEKPLELVKDEMK